MHNYSADGPACSWSDRESGARILPASLLALTGHHTVVRERLPPKLRSGRGFPSTTSRTDGGVTTEVGPESRGRGEERGSHMGGTARGYL